MPGKTHAEVVNFMWKCNVFLKLTSGRNKHGTQINKRWIFWCCRANGDLYMATTCCWIGNTTGFSTPCLRRQRPRACDADVILYQCCILWTIVHKRNLKYYIITFWWTRAFYVKMNCSVIPFSLHLADTALKSPSEQ